MDYDTLRNILSPYRDSPEELVEAFNLGCRTEREAAKIRLRNVTEQRNKAWLLAEHRERNIETERKLQDKLDKTLEALEECIAMARTSKSAEAAHLRLNASKITVPSFLNKD